MEDNYYQKGAKLAIDPSQFYNVLRNDHVFRMLVANPAFDGATRDGMMDVIVENTGKIFFDADVSYPSAEALEITLVGQQHNNYADYINSREMIRAKRDSLLLLERNGNLHPNLGSEPLTSIAAENNHTVLKEDELYGGDPKVLSSLLPRERSQIIALYISALIWAQSPHSSIIVVVGDRHVQEIQEYVLAFLPPEFHDRVHFTPVRSKPTTPLFKGMNDFDLANMQMAIEEVVRNYKIDEEELRKNLMVDSRIADVQAGTLAPMDLVYKVADDIWRMRYLAKKAAEYEIDEEILQRAVTEDPRMTDVENNGASFEDLVTEIAQNMMEEKEEGVVLLTP